MPGSPDLVVSDRRAAIFVHGCFWHRHYCQVKRRGPVTNGTYWRKKIERNQKRDRRVTRILRRRGWRVLVIWECQTRDQARLAKQIGAFLDMKKLSRRNASK
jgi:DNA mismatch endonuclease (patch repair protein)